MAERNHDLSLTRQTELLGISRGRLYYEPRPVSDEDLRLMDCKGAWRDNVFVERLWRTIKYEEVYLRAYDSVPAARESLGRYLVFYNSRRPHSSLDGQTPDQAYINPARLIPAAA